VDADAEGQHIDQQQQPWPNHLIALLMSDNVFFMVAAVAAPSLNAHRVTAPGKLNQLIELS
jgi:hypothetical protein